MSAFRSLVTLLFLAAQACVPAAMQGTEPPASSEHPLRPREIGGRQVPLARLPLSFVENDGQTDERAHFTASRGGSSTHFTSNGLRISMPDLDGTRQRWNLELGFEGARATRPAGEVAAGVASFFKGGPEDWVRGAPMYEGLFYRDLWPGIDLAFSGATGSLKYEYRVAPGADPRHIRLAWRGATEVSLDARGNLIVETPAGRLTDEAPTASQRIDGRTVSVPAQYELDGQTVAIRLGAFDATRPLLIDPVIVFSAGYIGGAEFDQAGDVAVDAAGNIYVTGETFSSEATFPETLGPDLTYSGGGGGSDAFIAKLDPTGTSIVYAGYIGGSGSERGQGVGVDAAGNAYVAGDTSSTEATFPVKGGPDVTYNFADDAFVAKVNASGTDLVYAGYIGGDEFDRAWGLAVEPAGNAYVAGATRSTSGTFPDLVGPDTDYNGGSADAFVAKVGPSGALAYAGYIGGGLNDQGIAVAVDGAGSAYVTGTTLSDEGTFIVAGGPDISYNGMEDGFIAKVNPDGVDLAYSGFIGGTQNDYAYVIAVDGSGSAYVAGDTESPEGDFPTTVGPDLTYAGGADAFVAKVAPSGAPLVYAGYIGGSAYDFAGDIALDAAGNLFFAGGTASTEATFPLRDGPDLTYNGGALDAFVSQVVAPGTGLAYSGYLGGAASDYASGAVLDPAGILVVVGSTESNEASFPVLEGPDLAHNGGRDGFVAKVGVATCLGQAANLVGTNAGDVIMGTSGADVIFGGSGNDTIQGLGGNDLICGGLGNDVLIGGEGNDGLDGGIGTDTASFPGSAGIRASLAAGTASGAGSDTVAGVENLQGGDGRDRLVGDAGPNKLEGMGGKDVLTGGAGDDLLDGGSGKDTAAFPGSSAVKADLAKGTATGVGTDALTSIESLTGSSSKDVLKGDRKANRLVGRGKGDRLVGRRGKDTLLGGAGADALRGGRGKDSCNGGKGRDTASACETELRIP